MHLREILQQFDTEIKKVVKDLSGFYQFLRDSLNLPDWFGIFVP